MLPYRAGAMDPPEERPVGQNEKKSLKESQAVAKNTRYQLLLSVIEKSLSQSRETIANDAPSTIADSYGDLTSLFATENDYEGIETLTTLLMGTLERVQDDFYSSEKTNSSSLLGKLLKEQQICELLQKVQKSIEEVEKEETEWEEKEEQDSQSAREAVNMARLPVVTMDQEGSKRGKRKLVLPAEFIGYHAYQLKLEHHQKLLKEISELEDSNTETESNLKEKWEEWTGRVEKVKGIVETLDELGSAKGDGEDDGGDR